MDLQGNFEQRWRNICHSQNSRFVKVEKAKAVKLIISGYRLTNEHAVRALIPWKRIHNGAMVTIHDVFTNRAFGDSSLLFVTDYHPCSETLTEHYTSHSHG